VTGVLLSIETQHARADHLSGREAAIIDGERLGVAQHHEGKLVARHQPAVERRQPGDGFPLTQSRKNRMRITI
jgi:hypothetical protein